MRLGATKTGASTTYNGLGDQLYDKGGARPTLDLNFASNGSLVDSVTGKTLVTHTRASNATYVDGDGVIKDAVTNHLLYSTMNNVTYWTAINGTYTVDQTTAPDETLTASKFSEDSAADGKYFRQINHNVTFTVGKFYILSAYFKEGVNSNQRYAGLLFSTQAFGNFKAAIFDLTGNGSVTPHPNLEPDVYGIESVGNGWYRCWIGHTATATDTNSNSQWRISNSSNNVFPAYQGDGSSHIFVWGSQLEEFDSQQSTPGEYVKTTSTINSAPRFDHNPTTGESLGLLVEESRTNLRTYSEDFTGYSKTSASVTSNQITAPDGTQTADLLTCTSTGDFNGRVNFTAQDQIAVISVFAKKGSTDWLHITLGANASIARRCWYNLATGQIGGTAGASGGGGTLLDQSMVDQGNGWYRCILAADCGSGNTWIGTSLFQPSDNDTNTNATVGNSIYLWGAQLEAGSFPTSYIRTSGSTATRSADVTTIDGNDFGTFNLLQYSEEFPDFGGNPWVKVGATIKRNLGLNALGKYSGVEIAGYGHAWHRIRSPFISLTSGTTYTLTVFYRFGTSGGFTFRFRDNTNASESQVHYNGSTYSYWAGVGPITLISDEVQSDGVTRKAVITFVPNSTQSNWEVGIGPNSTVIGETIIALAAQLEESSTTAATPYVKSDVTWTSRASNATYYDYTGTLRKSSYNRLTYSEDFSQWNQFNVDSVTADAIIAPDNKSTATLVVPTDTISTDRLTRSVTVDASTTYVLSVYLKSNGITSTSIRYYSDSGFKSVLVDLSAGTISANQGTTDNRVVENVGNGWYRFSFSFDSGTDITNSQIQIVRGSAPKDGINGYYLWGAQLETGPYAGDYAKTEASAASSARNVAFLPDGSGNFVSAGELLLEDAATNLVTYSEEFDQWLETNCPVTSNTTTAPDGTLTADKLVPDTVSGKHMRYFGIGTSSGVNQTTSVYAKAAEYDRIQLVLGSNGYGSAVKAKYNLTTGTSEITTFGTNTTANIEPVGNGWYRCILSSEATANANPQHQIRVLDENGYFDFVGDDVKGVFVWGAQIERSAYATSYIPTYSSTATRAADVSSSSSNTFGNSFYNQTEGTVFAQGGPTNPTISKTQLLLTINDDSANNRIYLGKKYDSTTAAEFGVTSGGVGQAFILTTPSSISNARLAAGYKVNDFAVASSGGALTTDTSGSVPISSTQLLIGTLNTGSNNIGGHIRRLTVWPTRLSNDTLKTITA